jgi:hypothetical protein
MDKLKLLLLVAFTFIGSRAFAQQYVPPPPSYPSTGGTVIQAPPGPPKVPVTPTTQIRFGNGARVAVYPDKFVLIEPDGSHHTKSRPLPDLARNPNGCKWLKHYLDTTSPYTRNWGDNLQVYLERCLNLR